MPLSCWSKRHSARAPHLESVVKFSQACWPARSEGRLRHRRDRDQENDDAAQAPRPENPRRQRAESMAMDHLLITVAGTDYYLRTS